MLCHVSLVHDEGQRTYARDEEDEELKVIALADAIMNIGAMMVDPIHAIATLTIS